MPGRTLDCSSDRPDPEAERRQRQRLERTKAARDPAAVERALAELRRAAADPERNLMEPRAGPRAAEGEIVAALQEVFGTYSEQPQF